MVARSISYPWSPRCFFFFHHRSSPLVMAAFPIPPALRGVEGLPVCKGWKCNPVSGTWFALLASVLNCFLPPLIALGLSLCPCRTGVLFSPDGER